ncbi:uncharacterized protein LOC107361382 [Tetranychus urticae]|uniref:uncharacterized protein LOC107361382 n=1 Tax=Tetranychus urticae TaxID=32264 RepID=UPI00077BDD67|nr:uncharacterized protein LOC107361382 [Tetranychus urticae]XP_025016350.1 uncharacterized protein LOC107361382 [Tetranychus urticae]
MNEVDQNCDDELIIVNRRCEYCVSKKFICSVVPYFKKLFSGDELESKENKVTLDFDEHVFDSILSWIHTGLFIMQMDYVILFYEAADYLMISDLLFESCFEYFRDNFTIKYLPIVLTQVKKSSKLITSGAIDFFICRHFLKIANTDTFLDYPVETLEHILKLDLMIYSEYQVFESIMKWANKNEDSRKEFLLKLLTFVRWSFMDSVGLSKIKDNELMNALQNFDSIVSSNVDCGFNRTKQNVFVSLQRVPNGKLRVKIFDKHLFSLPIGDFTEDKTMSLEFVHGEHISDIIFDTGRDCYRVDWDKKTFRWLDTHGYYPDINNVIVNFQDNRSQYSCYLDAKATALGDEIPDSSYLLLEYNDGFFCIGETFKRKCYGIFPATDSRWFNDYEDCADDELHATILGKVVYVLTAEFNFFQFNIETRSYKKLKLFEGAEDHEYDEFILTSLHTEDDKVILVNKWTGKFYVYFIKQKKWSDKYEILNANPDFDYSDEDSHDYELITFTSTFLPMKNIKPLFRREFL